MQRLSIRHSTRYDYDGAVSFTPHKLLVRPRDSHAMRLRHASLEMSVPGPVRWSYDALGNCVCTYTPAGQARSLEVVSRVVVERYPGWLDPSAGDPNSAFPVVYSPEDRIVLEPMIAPQVGDPSGGLTAWLRQLVGQTGEPALNFIQRLNGAIHQQFQYMARYDEGVQTPTVTLASRTGACRDFAWLMVESLRSFGFAARFVSGYLYAPRANLRGAGATHAWCEVFLPGLGWTEFDPTNGLAESADLIPVAIARTPSEAAPISGAIRGDFGTSRMTVSVDVRPDRDEPVRQSA